MKSYRLAIFAFVVLVSAAVRGQLFHPLGLAIETPDLAGDFCPQMHIEGDILFVCTKQGLYSKDLSNDDSAWQLVGFEGIPLQNYARSGDDIIYLVGLNIDISAYTEGLYTVTVENSQESFTGEFNSNTTGIEEVRSKRLEPSNHYIYNLQGQRLSTLQKGLNIVVDGRKVYVK